MPGFEFTGLLALAHVRQCMWEAWRDSLPDDPVNRHEQGGYIVRNDDGTIGCERWPRGDDEGIDAPELQDGRYDGRHVIGEFYTHPSQPPMLPEPSYIDVLSIAAREYELESFVVSAEVVYEVRPNGLVIDLPFTAADLNFGQ